MSGKSTAVFLGAMILAAGAATGAGCLSTDLPPGADALLDAAAQSNGDAAPNADASTALNSDGGGDGGSSGTCLVPTTHQNNEVAIGAYCEANKNMCTPPAFCTADYTPGITTGFCSQVCNPASNGCGSNEICYTLPKPMNESICIPACCADNSCFGGKSASADAAASD